MRFLRLCIKNFRNFREVDVRLGAHVVLLGENGAGKSNLLHALRLVLDTELPDASRYLAEEDFWDGGPAFCGTEIVVSVDLTDYQGDATVLACLADHEVTTPPGWSSSVARLTYRYAPRATVDKANIPTSGKDDYEFTVYGRDDQANVITHDVRRFLGFRVMHALRDAETDLRSWRRSPMRPLLEDARDRLQAAALEKVAKQVDAATDAITSEKPLKELEAAMRARIDRMLGGQHGMAPTFGFTATDPHQLVHALRLFMDDKRKRRVADTSLGLANVLYLSLLLLHAEQQVTKRATATTVLGIEEPEAHLHPQMQRLVFRDLLNNKVPIIVSTHSPNIASVAPIDSLAVLQTTGKESSIFSVAAATTLTQAEIDDLTRYLDVTRAEILFGRGIVLVEGDAERFLVPAAAGLLPSPVSVDEFGISVCSVAGTDFKPYAKLLTALNIPFVILTDGDEDDAGATDGLVRGIGILKAIGKTQPAEVVEAEVAQGKKDDARAELAKHSVFVGHRTLEADLLATGCGPRMKATFQELFPTSRDGTSAAFEVTGPVTDVSERAVIRLVERAGKGRFAQSLVSRLVATDLPAYIRDGLISLTDRCRRA